MNMFDIWKQRNDIAEIAYQKRNYKFVENISNKGGGTA